MPRKSTRSGLLGRAFIIATVVACGEPVPYPAEPGEFCSGGEPAVCVGSQSILVCGDDRAWVEETCTAMCGSAQPVACTGGACACDGPCDAGCRPDGTFAECGADGETEVTTCEAVCADAGGLALPGCTSGPDGVPSCLCTLEGLECAADSANRCLDGGTVTVCTDGVWTNIQCDPGCRCRLVDELQDSLVDCVC